MPGNANPIWKTKFATLVDDANFQDIALHVEVYSREPIFLRERLQGTATVLLKEFLAKYSKSSEASRPGKEEVGSYQLRKRNSGKPQGFIDISIRVSEDRGEPSSYAANEGGIVLMDNGGNIALSSEENQSSNFSYAHPSPYRANYSNPSMGGPSYPPAAGPSYHPPRTPPPPPPPPSNVGYVPTFLPNSDYINMPSSAAAPGLGARPGLAMGVGAGALAAGAVIFGDDFMSGFDIPASLPDPSLTISTDPPF
ncbi:hypothetical protein GH714_008217 [Hevea brasiliensis]|uniref:C2 domain-containing protein n=1 Tax=Hevea brasiliensis TaxID=3981 RepID=A0A6A6LZK0_HEVBR|nr:hypothetical protein GH714_008217 [Hevea brasiliensis]